MKKTFTLLATAVLFTSAAFAQYNGRSRDNGYGNNNPHDVVINNPDRGYGYDDRGGRDFYEREKNMQIARINHEYNERIESVRNNFFMRWHKKQRIIESLQVQRDEEIRLVFEKYRHHEYRHRDNDDYDDHDRRNW